MEFDAFTARLGSGQGRIAPRNHQPFSGEHVFVLGENEPRRRFDLAASDYAEVYQDVDVTDQDIVRVHLHLRVPRSTPAGLHWEAGLVVDGVMVAKASCPTGRERTITDLVANVSKLSGVHRIGVRLMLVEM